MMTLPSATRLAIAWILLALPATAIAWPEDARLDRLQQQHDERLSQFEATVANLMTVCRDQGLSDAVAELTVWMTRPDPAFLELRPLPDTVQPDLPANLPLPEKTWRLQLLKARGELADDLYLLSRRMLTSDAPSAAWRLIREIVWYDPDNTRARELLGYERYEDSWVTPFAAQMLKRNYLWTDRFGWLPAAHVERYENGERYNRNRWYSAARDAELHHDFRNAWEVETDNYLVKTNVSLEQGVELSQALERFHAWFRRAFPSFFDTPDQLKKMFAGTPRSRRVRAPFVVHFYRTQDEYIVRLIKKNPQIEITNGIYMPDERVAHFFNTTETDIHATLYHEATHQILFELNPQAREIAEQAHFWIIEGFACYMESFRSTERGVEIGDPEYIRFAAARYRLLEDGYYLPLHQFTAMGKTPFYGHPSIAMNYSQASGLAHFFMNYNKGQYRDALINHIALLYQHHRPGTRIPGLDEFTGVPYETLDAQYRGYITSLGTPVAQ